MTRLRLAVVGAALSVLLGTTAAADGACTAATAGADLDALETVLEQPEARKAMQAAQTDFAADGDFDDEANAKYLAAAAMLIQVRDHLNAGYIEEACDMLQKSKPLRDEITAGQ